MELPLPDGLLFMVSYLRGRSESEVRAAFVDAVHGAQRSGLELPEWVLDVLNPVPEQHAGVETVPLFG
jgi:hypothetical protein